MSAADSAPVNVTAVEADSRTALGRWEVTIVRHSPEDLVGWPPPSAADVPLDVRAALIRWAAFAMTLDEVAEVLR